MTESQPLPRPDEETPQAQAERLLVQIKEPHLEPHDGNWDSDCTPCKAQLELECCAVTIVEAYRSALAKLDASYVAVVHQRDDLVLWKVEQEAASQAQLHSLERKSKVDDIAFASANEGLVNWQERFEQADQQRRSAEELVLAYEKNLADAQADIAEEVKAREDAEAGRAPLRALVEQWRSEVKELRALQCNSGNEVVERYRLSRAIGVCADQLEAVLQGSRPPLEPQEKKDREGLLGSTDTGR